MSASTRGSIVVMFAATLWGLAGTMAKYLFAERSIAPFLLVQVRMGLGFVLLAGTLAIFAPRLLRLRRAEIAFTAIWGIAGMAMVNFAYFFTISQTNVATAIFLQYLAPVLTAVWAWLVEKEPVGRSVGIALGVALIGSVLLIFGGTLRLLVSPLGLGAGLASAVFFAFYTIFGSRGVGRVSPWTLLCYGLGFGTLLWVVTDAVLALAGHPLQVGGVFRDPVMWGFFLYIATLATILPFGLYLTGLTHISPTMATITGMLEPVVAGVASYFLLGEALRGAQVMGGGLIVGAVVLLQYNRSQGVRPSVPPAKGQS